MWELNQKIDAQTQKNQVLKTRNETLDAEVRDLKSGQAAIEERARSELGMVKQDEVFYQVLENSILPETMGSEPMTPQPIAPEATSSKPLADLPATKSSASAPNSASKTLP